MITTDPEWHEAAAPASDDQSEALPKGLASHEAASHSGGARIKSFTEFVESEMPRLTTFLARQGYNRADADDIVQDTFLALFRVWGTVSAPRRWIYVVARRMAIREVQRKSRELSVNDGWLAETPDRESVEDLTLETLALHEVLDTLPDRQRDVLLGIVQGMTPIEIAHTLNISPHAVRSHLRTSRMKIRGKLGFSAVDPAE